MVSSGNPFDYSDFFKSGISHLGQATAFSLHGMLLGEHVKFPYRFFMSSILSRHSVRIKNTSLIYVSMALSIELFHGIEFSYAVSNGRR